MARDWATINEYIQLLEPFSEATKLLEGRGKVGRHGAIWEVIITFEWLLDELEQQKSRLSQVDYNDPDAPEDHLKVHVNLAHAKLSEYYYKFDDAPVYYTATILHPHYKLHLDALWGVPDDHDEEKDGPHYRKDWLPNNNKGFIKLYKSYKEKLAIEAGRSSPSSQPPTKKPRISSSSSRLAFLQNSRKLAITQAEEALDDEYKLWKRQPCLEEDDPLSLNPVRYWLLHEKQFPVLARLALDIYSIPASSADCERTFSELGDLIGTRRLRMKPELISALQSLKSWKKIGIQPVPTATIPTTEPSDDLSKIIAQLEQFEYI